MFKLVRVCSGDDLRAANAKIDAWQKTPAGIRVPRIMECDDATIVDMLL